MQGIRPKVSVLCTAFNHERFIRHTLEGFVAQQTDFPFEVIVHDDASTDGTAAIIREFHAAYPLLIKPIFQTVNQYRLERGRVTRIVQSAAKGEFWAICEGDDYWIDPFKLRDQVALLEARPEFTACVTEAWSETDGKRESAHLGLRAAARAGSSFGLQDILRENFVTTATLMLRRDSLMPLPDSFWSAPAGDWFMLVLLASKGRIGYIDRPTAVRSRHVGGAISMRDEVFKLLFSADCITAFKNDVPKHLQPALNDRIAELRFAALETAQKNGGLGAARSVWERFKGRGLPWRQRLRWSLLLSFPKLMSQYARLRA
ncbi:MAG TPA: glycosyltransferase [Flavobacteriales bacterium]|nr:glycosyltransferase [Flavobacteriales bacterium]